MISSIILWTIISLIIIIVFHNLFSFLKDTLTVPKVKDLICQPSKSYKEMEELSITSKNNATKTVEKDNNINPNEMKNELKNFFNELSKNKDSLPGEIPQGSGFSQNIYSDIQ